jgi:1-acyl-sn-glycerol-3-phosphate acyltransferase
VTVLALSWRLARVGLHLLSGMAQCALLFPVLPPDRRNYLVQRWSRQLTRIFGITVDVSVPAGGGAAGAVVANHVSWIDVFVLNAVAPCRFVAKSEVRRWPAIGWLSARAGTLYIARQKRSALVGANATIASHLAQGERLAFFPEGTSGPQGAVLPFHANLFQGIIESQAPVLPVAIVYFDANGALSAAVEYIGDMSLWESIIGLLSHGPFVATVAFLPPIASSEFDRRALAAASRRAVAARVEATAAGKNSSSGQGNLSEATFDTGARHRL